MDKQECLIFMYKNIVIKKINANIKSYLSNEYKVLIFGSWARGDALETSDIDIGILGKQKALWDIMLRITGEAEAIPTLRKIDIVDLKKADASFRKEVLSYAKSI